MPVVGRLALIRATAIVAGITVADGPGYSYAGGSTEVTAAALDDKSVWEIGAGVCAGGAFLAAYEAATATAPVAATGVGAGATGTAIVSAALIGCSLGLVTAAISFGAANAMGYFSGW
jgi:hypothetical protein